MPGFNRSWESAPLDAQMIKESDRDVTLTNIARTCLAKCKPDILNDTLVFEKEGWGTKGKCTMTLVRPNKSRKLFPGHHVGPVSRHGLKPKPGPAPGPRSPSSIEKKAPSLRNTGAQGDHGPRKIIRPFQKGGSIWKIESVLCPEHPPINRIEWNQKKSNTKAEIIYRPDGVLIFRTYDPIDSTKTAPIAKVIRVDGIETLEYGNGNEVTLQFTTKDLDQTKFKKIGANSSITNTTIWDLAATALKFNEQVKILDDGEKLQFESKVCNMILSRAE